MTKNEERPLTKGEKLFLIIFLPILFILWLIAFTSEHPDKKEERLERERAEVKRVNDFFIDRAQNSPSSQTLNDNRIPEDEVNQQIPEHNEAPNLPPPVYRRV
ncbi:uncharacterized protein RJT21DRAFT_116193 [Scheffersomyces amazonensis]|uniref:uncharacterized protein n=1 Tax=Scheffersomyces amazonensis TaxID=1078765 RepID=UPI00315D7E6C